MLPEGVHVHGAKCGESPHPEPSSETVSDLGPKRTEKVNGTASLTLFSERGKQWASDQPGPPNKEMLGTGRGNMRPHAAAAAATSLQSCPSARAENTGKNHTESKIRGTTINA